MKLFSLVMIILICSFNCAPIKIINSVEDFFVDAIKAHIETSLNAKSIDHQDIKVYQSLVNNQQYDVVPGTPQHYHTDHHIIPKKDIKRGFYQAVLALFSQSKDKKRSFVNALKSFVTRQMEENNDEDQSPVNEFILLRNLLVWVGGNVVPGPYVGKQNAVASIHNGPVVWRTDDPGEDGFDRPAYKGLTSTDQQKFIREARDALEAKDARNFVRAFTKLSPMYNEINWNCVQQIDNANYYACTAQIAAKRKLLKNK